VDPKIETFLGPEMATHVHKITNVPGFLGRLDLIILMRANPLLGPLEEVGLENLDFFWPKWHSFRSLPLQGPKKS
jgi:hypothetical protein